MSTDTTTPITPHMITALALVGRPVVIHTPHDGPVQATCIGVDGYDWQVLPAQDGSVSLTTSLTPLGTHKHTPLVGVRVDHRAADWTYSRTLDEIPMDRITRGVTLAKASDRY